MQQACENYEVCHGRSGQNFLKSKPELVDVQCEMLENAKVGTAANFCSPEARGTSPTYRSEPAFSRSYMYKMRQ